VNEKASPSTTQVPTGTSATQQDAPKFTVTTSPPAGSSAAQPGSPQIVITPNPPAASPAPGSAAPEFVLQDLKGRPIQLSKLRGRVVVVNFWATWCGPCRMEIPGFVKVYEKYREKGLEIVGISINDAGLEVVRDFVAKNSINYPVALDTGQVAQRYGGITRIPTTFIIDRQGRIAKDQILGAMPETSFEEMIKPLL